jgi:serine protease AprX
MHVRLAPVSRTAVAGVIAASLLGAVPAPAGSTSSRELIVTAGQGGVSAAADAVRAAGGKVLSELALINGVIATVPAGRTLPSTVQVAPDRPVSVDAANGPAGAAVSTVRATLGLTDDGNEGAGVTVAVVDTGVADVPDLAGAVTHVDVTGEGTGDGFGHGTFMAGLIAGSGASSGGRYRGVAPAAGILDVRVAAANGDTSLITVLRGLEVVARHREVRVLNLSLSSGSDMPWQRDPLTRALDALWARGVVVVVPAGNSGPESGTVTSPGNDPTLLTVGGIDEAATAARLDDSIAIWSGRGPAAQNVAKPDLAAPGSHVVSLRAPGSFIDTMNPTSREGESYFRGSGTSMSTAVTSAAAAAVLAARPSLRPAQVKALLTGTAYDAAGLADPEASGAGGLDLAAALTAAVPQVAQTRAAKVTLPRWVDGAEGSWELFARAWSRGDYAATARAWSKLSPEARAWAARAWSVEVWANGSISDEEWAARAWSARAWSARAWSGDEWLARAWSARAWSADDWAARAWSARSWSARSWSEAEWDARSWSARSWSARSWSARSWSARSWSARSWSTSDWN